MPRRGTSKNDKPSSNARTSSQTASPALQALVQRLSRLHYGSIDESGVQYLQRIANRLHNYSRVPLRSSTVKGWKEDLDCSTILYHVIALAPSLSVHLTRVLQHLGDDSVSDLKNAKPTLSKVTKSLALLIATILAVNALVRDLLPLVDSWTCFDSAAENGQTVYLDALLAVLAKHKLLLGKLDKVGRFAKVKAAFDKANKAVSATKGGDTHDKTRKTLAKLQTQLEKAIDVYQEHYLKYLSHVKDSRGRRPFRNTVPSDLLDDGSVSSASTRPHSVEEWPHYSQTYRRPSANGSLSSEESQARVPLHFRSESYARLPPPPTISEISSNASDPENRRANFFQTNEARLRNYHDFPPLPPPPLPPLPSPSRELLRSLGLPEAIPPPPRTIENWRQTVAENTPVPPGNVTTVPSGTSPLPPMPRTQSPAQTITVPHPSSPPPLRPPMVLPPPLHPPMAYPPPPPTPPSDERLAAPFPGPVLPRPPPSASRPPSSVANRSVSSRSDSSGGHWNHTMRDWAPPPPREPEIRWPDLPQALTDAYKQLQAKDSEFREAQARYVRLVRKRDADLRKAHAFDQLPKPCCELLLFLHNNFDLYNKAKKPRSATKLVRR